VTGQELRPDGRAKQPERGQYLVATTLEPQPALESVEARRGPDTVALLTFYLVLLLAIPASLVFAPLGAAGGPATLFAVMLLVCYLLMRLHPGFNLGTSPQPVRAVGAIFLCSVLAAYVSANRHYLPHAQMNAADRGIISIAGWLAVLVVAADGIDRASRLKTLLSRMTTGVTMLAIVGIAEVITGVDIAKYVTIPGLSFNQIPTDTLVRDGFSRPFATTAQPLEFAALMVIALPVALHQARFAPPGLRLRRWLKVATIAVAIAMTVSRTALLGVAITALVLLPTWPRSHRRRAYAVVLACGAVLFLAAPSLLGAFGSLLSAITQGSASTDSRTTAAAQALAYITQHPWLGRGFGTFLPQTYFFTDDEYLSTLITTGIIGLCCLAALFVTGWLAARSVRRRSRDVETRDLAQSLAAAIAVAACCFATFDVLSFTMAAGLTFLMIGCAGAAVRLSSTAGGDLADVGS
jgi:polysaccharide biosynthesis protein PslJ